MHSQSKQKQPKQGMHTFKQQIQNPQKQQTHRLQRQIEAIHTINKYVKVLKNKLTCFGYSHGQYCQVMQGILGRIINRDAHEHNSSTFQYKSEQDVTKSILAYIKRKSNHALKLLQEIINAIDSKLNQYNSQNQQEVDEQKGRTKEKVDTKEDKEKREAERKMDRELERELEREAEIERLKLKFNFNLKLKRSQGSIYRYNFKTEIKKSQNSDANNNSNNQKNKVLIPPMATNNNNNTTASINQARVQQANSNPNGQGFIRLQFLDNKIFQQCQMSGVNKDTRTSSRQRKSRGRNKRRNNRNSEPE